MNLDGEDFVYVDQNILIYLRDGKLSRSVFEDLLSNNIRAVYSDETLKEISRASSSSEGLLEVLRALDAAHLRPILDRKNHLSASARVTLKDPSQAFREYELMAKRSPLQMFGMQDVLFKQFGGKDERTNRQILEKGASDLSAYVRNAVDKVDDSDPMSRILKSQMMKVEELIFYAGSSLADAYEKTGFQTVREIDALEGFGPTELNNLTGPHILKKVWHRLSKSSGAGEQDPETQFLQHLSQYGATSKPALANSIYSYLNFVGYWRDKKLMNRGRFDASISDSSHAGLASYCRFLISGDRPMLKKTFAAFEYLDIGTTIIIFDPESQTAEIFPAETEDGRI